MEKLKRDPHGEKPLAIFQRNNNVMIAIFWTFSAVLLLGAIDIAILNLIMAFGLNRILPTAPFWGFLLLAVHIFLIISGVKRLERFFHTRIRIYDDGIELQQGNSYLFATWDEIVSFAKIRVFKDVNTNEFETIFGLKLNQSIRPEKDGYWESLFIEPGEDFLQLSWDFLKIPHIGAADEARVDREALARTEFGKMLFHYAPQLFGDEETRNQMGATEAPTWLRVK